ncbi:hypothetical protein G4Y79_06675 [Phototrophicus methaneseepsis]|uniref:Uncharacterized protein n=1 Tax=Phototrophicus methaneseepsis TaxID=2710758 RepID=A0A7S8IGI8_9CHLR|nr:hypothetical protein [Phototrophicus methaneseepsis]QPC84058.1 hypothetical protein G4Y79_06675 [Phototrophicus methaneseepsis]
MKKKKLETLDIENMILELKSAGALPANMSFTLERTADDELLVRTSTAYPPTATVSQDVVSVEMKTLTEADILKLYRETFGDEAAIS